MNQEMDAASFARRILHFLAMGPASLVPAAVGGGMQAVTDRGAIAIEPEMFGKLVEQGLLVRTSHSIALSDRGRLLADLVTATRRSKGRAREIELAQLPATAGQDVVLMNLAESPLAQLVRRKTKDGSPFLAAAEFEAGERLRADYTRGQIMPRLGANWIAGVALGKRSGAGGVADLTDAALAARRRVEAAIETVGPELSGVLIDVCCFLKGLELIETERGWPVRSAKIVLKTALGTLARHYNPRHAGATRRSASILRWGTADYRPRIG